MNRVQQTIIKFPEIDLKQRDAHKLRGYFGNLFKEHSPLLHNHYSNGEFRNRYPLVQYKVINNTPMLVALEEGAQLLQKLFLQVNELKIDGETYTINNKQIDAFNPEVGYIQDLKKYRFQSLWMALNQTNFKKYINAGNNEKTEMLKRILIGNILSFYKGIDLHLTSEERLMLSLNNIKSKNTKFKDKNMLAFTGEFIVNASLPNYIGLGKSVSRGFGTIKQINS